MMTKSVFLLALVPALPFFAPSLYATDYTFPTVNGDLTSPTDWKMDPIPGAKDNVLIDTAGNDYKISKDVIFGNIQVTATGTTYLKAPDVTVTVKADSYPFRMIDSSTKRYVHLDGGVWDANGQEFKGLSKDSCLYLKNGAILTNVACCWVSSLSYANPKFYLTDKSRIHCSEFRINNMTSSGNGFLSVKSGSRVEIGGTFYTDTGTANYTKSMNTKTVVSDQGSEISCNLLSMGYRSSGHTVSILDGGLLDAKRVQIAASGATGKDVRILVTNATLNVDEYLVINSTTEGSGNGILAKDATISIGGGFTNNCNAAFCDFQDVNLTVGGPVKLFAAGPGAKIRFGGSKGTEPAAMKSMADYFPYVNGGGGSNELVIDDGFVMTNTVAQRLCTYMSDCTVRVSGGAKMINEGKTIHLGHEDHTTSISNTLAVLDGGFVQARDVRLISTGNRIVVSNGTIKATNGIMLGYQYSNKQPTSGARAVLQGATPRLECGEEGALWVKNDTNLRIEIPAEGYAPGYVPITAKTISFDRDATLGIEYAAFLAAGGGELMLMAFAEDVSDKSYGGVTFLQWLKREETAMNLPKGCKLRLVVDANGGSRVVFRAGPPPGMMLIFR